MNSSMFHIATLNGEFGDRRSRQQDQARHSSKNYTSESTSRGIIGSSEFTGCGKIAIKLCQYPLAVQICVPVDGMVAMVDWIWLRWPWS